MKKFLLVILSLLSITAFSQSIPDYKGYVNDFAGILSPQTEARLSETVLAYEKQSSIEIAIVTVKDLQGVVIEDYCMKLATQWKVGKKGLDNGLVMFVSIDPSHRGFRIEVGYGLEGRMTDAEAGNITRSTVQNYFKRGAFDEGMMVALGSVLKVLGPETKEQFAAYQAQKKKDEDASKAKLVETITFVIVCIIAVLFVSFILYLLYWGYKKKQAKKEELLHAKMSLSSAKTDAIAITISKLLKDIEPLAAEDFYGAKKAVNLCIAWCTKITVLGQGLPSTATAEMYWTAQKQVTDFVDDCKKVVGVVLTNARIAKEVSADKKKFADALVVAEGLIKRNRVVADAIDAENPKSVWTQTDPKVLPAVAFGTARTYAKKSLDMYADAVTLIGDNKFDKADDAHKGAHVYLSKAIAAANYPTALKKELADKKKETEKMLAQLDALQAKAEKSVDREHVNATTKRMLNEVGTKRNAIKKAQGVDCIDWFLLFLVVYALYTHLSRTNERANDDVQHYNDEVRRRKEEHDEEERRARRRREDSERSSYGSTSSSSFGSFFSSSGGGSSFGGGSFGGGGSTSSW